MRARREGWAKLTHKASVAISGLTMHVTHSVSIRPCYALRYKLIRTVLVVGPIPHFVGPEAPNSILSCVGSLIVLAVVGSMSLILANCEPELSPIFASVLD